MVKFILLIGGNTVDIPITFVYNEQDETFRGNFRWYPWFPRSAGTEQESGRVEWKTVVRFDEGKRPPTAAVFGQRAIRPAIQPEHHVEVTDHWKSSFPP